MYRKSTDGSTARRKRAKLANADKNELWEVGTPELSFEGRANWLVLFRLVSILGYTSVRYVRYQFEREIKSVNLRASSTRKVWVGI